MTWAGVGARAAAASLKPDAYALYGLAGKRQALSAMRSGLFTSDCTVALAIRTRPSFMIAGAIRRLPVSRTPGM